MLDFNPIELMVVAVVALLVIGPKDLPKAMRFVGQWMGKARGVLRQVRGGFDTMVREAEIEEMEKKWAAENERIMREHALVDPQPALTAAVIPNIGETPPPLAKVEPSDPPVAADPAAKTRG